MSTFTVFLSNVPSQKVATIKALCALVDLHEPGFGGEGIAVEAHEDFTFVDGPNEALGHRLLCLVQNVIDGEFETLQTAEAQTIVPLIDHNVRFESPEGWSNFVEQFVE